MIPDPRATGPKRLRQRTGSLSLPRDHGSEEGTEEAGEKNAVSPPADREQGKCPGPAEGCSGAQCHT